ncbi:hypothetical protein C1646_771584 [Rhizophagus diaphanus]|nr:hypothetical protein C1646_771584 [Rhizophagus diaphanus] [Rhizophagus sp. MUCL 43196]
MTLKISLSRYTLSFKDSNYLSLPKFYIADINDANLYPYCRSLCDIIWKINIKKIISECFIKFIVKQENINDEHILKYEDILELKGLGWIEYAPFNSMILHNYVRFTNGCKQRSTKAMNHLLSLDQLLPFNTKNIPEALEDKYFSKKEAENLLKLKDILNNL